MSRSKIAMSESAKKEQQGATGARLRPLLPLKEAAPASHGEGAGEERAATTRDRLESELLDGREAAPRTSEARLMARLGGAGRRPATSRERLAVQLKERRSEAAREELVDEVASAGLQGPSTALPHLDRIQRAFGRHDVGGVKAHLDGGAAAANDRLGAHAYARGEHVAFARSPLLHTAAHEAAHVVQQRAGVSLSRGVGRAGDGYEQQADRVADHVVAGRSVEPLLDGVSGRGAGPRANAGSGGGVQMDIDEQKKGLADTVIGGAGGVASAGGGTSSLAGSISGMAHNTTAASGAASSASGFGGAGGIIGVAGAVSEGVEGGRDIHFDQQRGAAQQVLGGGARLTTAAGTAVSSAASATQNIATLAGNAGAAATAGMVGAGAAIAIGASE